MNPFRLIPGNTAGMKALNTLMGLIPTGAAGATYVNRYQAESEAQQKASEARKAAQVKAGKPATGIKKDWTKQIVGPAGPAASAAILINPFTWKRVFKGSGAPGQMMRGAPGPAKAGTRALQAAVGGVAPIAASAIVSRVPKLLDTTSAAAEKMQELIPKGTELAEQGIAAGGQKLKQVTEGATKATQLMSEGEKGIRQFLGDPVGAVGGKLKSTFSTPAGKKVAIGLGTGAGLFTLYHLAKMVSASRKEEAEINAAQEETKVRKLQNKMLRQTMAD